MKSNPVRLLIVMIFFLMISPAFSHPPVDIVISFDPDTKLLNLTILHPTPDVKKHIIDKIEIMLNEDWINKLEFKTQTDQEKHVAVAFLPGLKPGDEITVIAHCNVFGKKKVSYKLPNL